MTTTDINKIAAKARTLLEGISSANAKHDTLVADRNARVKPLLEQVHHTLVELKQPVEGVRTWDAWAKKAGWSKRNLNFILNGRPSQKKKDGAASGNSSSRPTKLKSGSRYEIGGWVFEVPKDEEGLVSCKVFTNPLSPTGKSGVITLHGVIFVEDNRKKPEPKKKTPRLTLRQTHIALNAIEKQVGKEQGTIEEKIEWAQKLLAAIEALNKAERKPHYSPWKTAKKHAEERLQFLINWKAEEELAAKQTHMQVANEPQYTHCVRQHVPQNLKITTDINEVDCEECKRRYEQDQELEGRMAARRAEIANTPDSELSLYDRSLKKRGSTVHAAGNIIDPKNKHRVRCSTNSKTVAVTDKREEVTCHNCMTGLDQDEQRAWMPEFYKTVPQGTSEKKIDQLWKVFVRAKGSRIYDPDKVTEVPCTPAEAMDWYKRYVIVLTAPETTEVV